MRKLFNHTCEHSGTRYGTVQVKQYLDEASPETIDAGPLVGR